MSPLEIGVIVVGVALGYWVVRKSLDAEPKKPAISKQANAKWDNSSEPSDFENLAGDGDLEHTWFQILDVAPTATSAQIAAAYKKKMSQYHPDKVQTLGSELRALAESKSKQINAAYDFATKRSL